MAIGKKKQRQDGLWIIASDLPRSPGHPFHQRPNVLLEARGFDRFAEQRGERFYAEGSAGDRPGMAPHSPSSTRSC